MFNLKAMWHTSLITGHPIKPELDLKSWNPCHFCFENKGNPS